MTGNRIDFSKGLLNKHLDNIPDGTSYVRIVAGDMTGNRVDFSKGLLNKHLDNIPDGATYGRHVVSDMTGNRVDFSKALLNKGALATKNSVDLATADVSNKTLDNVADGTRAAWSTITQKNAAVDASGNLLLK